MAGITQTFTLRTSSNVTSVYLVGSWDSYQGQLPLSVDGGSKKKGAWKGTFRFTGSTLKPGQRYWYYYTLDGYSVTHDPACDFTKEPTTGRLLNILDVSASSSAKNLAPLQIPRGRGVSPSRIACPKPSKPYASRKVREADYSHSPIDMDSATSELAGRLEAASLYGSGSSSPSGSMSSGFSSGRSSVSGPDSPASLSSLSDASASSCRCNRYGITRSGRKVLLDCGGSRCGYSDDSSSCGSGSDFDDSSEAEDSDYDDRRPAIKTIAPKGSSGHKSSSARLVTIAPKSAKVSSSRRR